MSDEETPAPAEQPGRAPSPRPGAALSNEKAASLAGFFDTLIEMDFEAKRSNEARSKHGTNHKTGTDSKQVFP